MSTSPAASLPSGGGGFSAPQPAQAGGTAMRILFAISAGHLLNDTIQSLLPAIYPVL